MLHRISPCAFIGEFDQELGTTIIYAFEYYRFNHVCESSQHPQGCTYPLCEAHFVRGTCRVTNNIISGTVQERDMRMLIHVASRLLNSHNSSQELMIMQSDESFAIAGIAFTLPDIVARGQMRHFCVFVLHPLFNVLVSQWEVINVYLRCLICQWQTNASARRVDEYNHVGNIEERRETAHRSALRPLLELIATNDNSNNINKDEINENNNSDSERNNVVDDNIIIEKQLPMNSMTYAHIHGFFEYAMPIFFACTYRSNSSGSSSITAGALSRSFEPQLPIYYNELQKLSVNNW